MHAMGLAMALLFHGSESQSAGLLLQVELILHAMGLQ